uniref:NADH:ubiquinone reductase (H(+)-translocating) n=1 Tax=Gnathostomula armata TaxID=231613 RepID=A0A0F6PZP1_9BILA|nr:NADH dehydrogenase subunit 5 [Gnathostomula armata]AKD00018.1 NADH dehydrogenase subunit 5 [Gnathostomula armata]
MLMISNFFMFVSINKFFLFFFSQLIVVLNNMNLLFFSSLVLIFFSVWFFSFFYMGSKSSTYFYILKCLFVFSMIIFILVEDFFFFFLGWDGLGVISFLLIVYYLNISSLKGGMITIFSNRMGDIMLIMSLFMFFMFSLSDSEMIFSNSYSYLVMMIFMLLCLSKSAQFPFMDWLPKAMAAPTPISALVHSSTLVTAGIFLSIKMMSKSMLLLKVILVISIVTLLFSSLSALVESDLKKLIALSTLSQLSLMGVTMSIYYINLSYYHMILHAFFKACLFCIIGFVMLKNYSEQMVMYFDLKLNMFLLFSFLAINCFSLAGLYFLSAFYSKDFILKFLFFNMSFFVYFMFYFACFCTVFYSYRFFKEINMKFVISNWSKKDCNFFNLLSIFFLSLTSILSSFYFSFLSFLDLEIQISSKNMDCMLVMIIVFSLILICLNFSFYSKKMLILFMNKMFVYKMFLNFLFYFSNKMWESFEKFWLENVLSMNFMFSKFNFENKNIFEKIIFMFSIFFIFLLFML